MPKLNEIKLGHEISKAPKFMAFIWTACEQCGKTRWVPYVKCRNEPKSKVCFRCARRLEKGVQGKGHTDKDGYILVSLPWGHPYLATANARGWILEHRLVMAQSLGRNLKQTEVVHHMNGNKRDNRVENLTILSRAEHTHREIPFKHRIQDLERTVKCLEARIKILESDIVSPQADCFQPAESSLKI